MMPCLNCVCVGGSHQGLLAHMMCAFASTSCSLPSTGLFLPATTQVFGHIPVVHTAAQPIQQCSTIGLLQRYLIGLIWAQKWHSCRIGLLINSRKQKSLHLLTFCSLEMAEADFFTFCTCSFKRLLSLTFQTSKLFDFFPNKRGSWPTKCLMRRSPGPFHYHHIVTNLE